MADKINKENNYRVGMEDNKSENTKASDIGGNSAENTKNSNEVVVGIDQVNVTDEQGDGSSQCADYVYNAYNSTYDTENIEDAEGIYNNDDLYCDFIFGNPEEEGKNGSEYSNEESSLTGFNKYIKFATQNDDSDILFGIRRKRGRGRPHSNKQEYTKDLATLVGKANLAYTKKEYAEAVRILQMVTKAAPHTQQPWLTLGMIHEELGDSKKALQAYLVAAHMSPKDIEQWKRLGNISVKFEYDGQALYCYSRALIICSTDIEILHARSKLFIRNNQLKKASVDLKSILSINPYDMIALRALVEIYIKTSNQSAGIELFERVVMKDKQMLDNISLTGYTPLMEYDDLICMADLYIYSTITPSTWFNLSTCYENITGKRNIHNINSPQDVVDGRFSDTSPDIYVRFGIVFLYLNQIFIAYQMFDMFISMYEPTLYKGGIMIADAYAKLGFNIDAIRMLEIIKSRQTEPAVEVLRRLAECYAKIGDFEKSAEDYSTIILMDENDQDARMALAKLYNEMGKEKESKEVAFKMSLKGAPTVNMVKKKIRAKGASSTFKKHKTAGEVISLSKSTMRPDKIIDAANLKEIADEIIELYDDIQKLYEKINDDHVVKAEYLKKTYRLIRIFQAIKEYQALQPGYQLHSEVSKNINCDNSNNLGRNLHINDNFIRDNPDIPDEALGEFLELCREFDTLDDEKNFNNNKQQTSRPNYYTNEEKEAAIKIHKKITPEQWYDIFIKTAYTVAGTQKYDEAINILHIASESSSCHFLSYDKDTKIKLKLHVICIALKAKLLDEYSDQCKRLVMHSPQCCEFYKLYSALIPTGKNSLPVYASSSNSKFFQRLLSKPSILPFPRNTSARSNTTPNSTLYNYVPILVTLAMISYCNKSYKIAAAYFLKAYVLSPKTPMINFLLGLSYINLSTLRTTLDKDLNVANAATFLFQYYELSNRDQESSYNMGRAFHHLGYTHLAIPYYEAVLSYEDESLITGKSPSMSYAPEAAYNLSRIYLLSGSVDLSVSLLSKYCYT